MTMIIGDNIERARILALRGHCRLLSKGLRHSRISLTRTRELVGEITGKHYKRGSDFSVLADDLTKVIESWK